MAGCRALRRGLASVPLVAAMAAMAMQRVAAAPARVTAADRRRVEKTGQARPRVIEEGGGGAGECAG
jgi:hypothetical protein